MGDATFPFQAGELMLYGANLPHQFKPNLPNGEHPTEGISAYVLHFPMDFVKNSLQNIPEFDILHHLLDQSPQGLRFLDARCQQKAGKLMRKMLAEEGFDRMLYFIRLLRLLAQQHSYELIASRGYVNSLQAGSERLEKVYQYISKYYDKADMTLEEVAIIANMNRAAFCRYFKKIAHKTFVQFLNEVRIGHACKLLLETNKSIAEVAFSCGYNNTSNFNRQFKLIKRVSPSGYLRGRVV
ncbi:MAG: helix-turn-helix domain-containing protein [Bacteroidota bacterium]